MVKITISSLIILLGVGLSFGKEGESLEARDHLDRIDDYILERSQTFKILDQKRDIFGLAQDIKKERLNRLEEIAKKNREKELAKKKKPDAPKRQKIALSKVVSAMQIAMTLPGSQKAIIDGRTMGRGQKLRLQAGQDSFVLRVEKIKADGVIFRDINTGELALKSTRSDNLGIQTFEGRGIKPINGIVPTGDANDSAIQIRVDPFAP